MVRSSAVAALAVILPGLAAAQEARSIFCPLRPTEVTTVSSAAPLWEVAPDQFYSAPWLIPPATVPESSGVLESFHGSEDLRNPRTTARVYDRMQVRITGAAPAVG